MHFTQIPLIYIRVTFITSRCLLSFCEEFSCFNIHHRQLDHLRRPHLEFRHRLLRNPSPMQPSPHGLLKIHLLPYPRRRTNERTHAWHTSSRTCGQYGTTPPRWQSCWQPPC